MENNCKLILGDCLLAMKEIADGSVDCVITDPPYGLGDSVTDKNNYNSYDDTKENLKNLIALFIPECLRIADRVVITSGVGNMHLYPQPTWTMAWVNKAGAGRSPWGFSCWQPIIVYGKDPRLVDCKGSFPDTYFQELNDVDVKKLHPCCKPTSVMKWIVDRTTRTGETILDPFMGSGTTGVACVQTGRNFIGMELDRDYFEIAKQRIESAQQPLFT